MSLFCWWHKRNKQIKNKKQHKCPSLWQPPHQNTTRKASWWPCGRSSLLAFGSHNATLSFAFTIKTNGATQRPCHTQAVDVVVLAQGAFASPIFISTNSEEASIQQIMHVAHFIQHTTHNLHRHYLHQAPRLLLRAESVVIAVLSQPCPPFWRMTVRQGGTEGGREGAWKKLKEHAPCCLLY